MKNNFTKKPTRQSGKKQKAMQKILEQDQALTDKIRIKDENNKIFRIAAFFSHTGDSWFWCGGLFIIWLFAHGSSQKTAAFWGISIAVTAVLIFILKRIIHRKRPEGNWGDIYRRTDPHSFPSGHAVRAGLIIVLAMNTFQFPLMIIFILWAILMVLSRVINGVHFLLDVTAGILIGLLIGICWIALMPYLFEMFFIVFDRSLWPDILKDFFG